MKTAHSIALAAAAFFVGIGVGGPAAKPSSYVDGNYGFSLKPPSLGLVEKGSQALVASFLGAATDGFAPNVNVMVQRADTKRDEFIEVTKNQVAEFEGGKLIVCKARTVNGCEAVEVEYEGTMNGRRLRFLTIALFATDGIYLATCTATPKQFTAHEKELRASAESFAIDASKIPAPPKK